jgi:hypothetical protein
VSALSRISEASDAQKRLIQLGGARLGYIVNNFRPYSPSSVPLGVSPNEALAAGIPMASKPGLKDAYTATLISVGGQACIYG